MNRTPASRGWSAGRWAPALLLSATLLAGCGPRSLSAHIPRPHFFFFQNATPVQSAPLNVLLPAATLPGAFQTVNSQADSNAAGAASSANAAATAASYTKWHRLDGAMANYEMTPDAGSSTLAVATRVQIAVGRYATEADAKGWFAEVGTKPPLLGQPQRLPDPYITAQDVYYQAQLPGLTARVLYFQQRNLVVRVTVLAPPGSAMLGQTTAIAQREHDQIASVQ